MSSKLSFTVERVSNGYLYLVANQDGSKDLFVFQTSNPPGLEELRSQLLLPEIEVPTPPKPGSFFDGEMESPDVEEEEEEPVIVPEPVKTKKKSSREVDLV